MKEDNRYIINGLPPLTDYSPKVSLGSYFYESLCSIRNDNPCLIDVISGETISSAQLLSKTCSLAQSLTRLGYGKNTTISICSENSINYFIPVISAHYIGAIVSPINPNYTKNEIIHVLNISKPELIFCSSTTYSKIKDVQKDLHFIKKIIIINAKRGLDEAEYLDSFTKEGSSRFDPVEVDIDEQIAFILTSSGTTGLPKGVMLTHKNISLRLAAPEDHRFAILGDGPLLGILPFFHAYGLAASLGAICRGRSIALLSKFDGELFLKTIEAYRITFLTLVPPLAVFLTKSPLVKKYNISSVVQLFSGAAPLSEGTELKLKEMFKVDTVGTGYGLTETTLSVARTLRDCKKIGSCGKIVPYLQCKVRDPETAESLGANKVGELCIRGDTVMKGYYNNEEATRNAFTSDGWLLTGDLGYYDEDEDFFIIDRLKELIKYKAFQVAPAELEAVLLTHLKILDAGVVGLLNEEDGEWPIAFVVAVPNSGVTEEDVKKFVAERVSPQKKLRGGVIFVENIPKNPSGKILRRELRNLLKKHNAKL